MTDDLGARLSDLWDAELANWHVDFDSSAGATDPWIVGLEWTSESANPHGADWVAYTWQFYGMTIEQALADAVAWCEGLVPFTRCPACGGAGSYWTSPVRDEPTRCDECGGTGLAHPPPTRSLLSEAESFDAKITEGAHRADGEGG